MTIDIEIDEFGFADPRAARSVARRLVLRGRMRCLVEVGADILDLLDQASQADSRRASALLAGDNGLALRDGERAIGRQSIDLIEREDVREKELLEGVNLVLKFLDSLRDGIGHGLFSNSVETGAERNGPCATAHRLSEGAK